MNSFDVTKRGKLYFLIALLIIAAGAVCFFAAGFAGADDFNGATEYSAYISSSADLTGVDEYTLAEDVKAAIGRDADVSLDAGYSSQTELTIRLEKDAELGEREKALVDMLSEKYADFGIESFSSRVIESAYDSAAIASYAAVLAAVLLALFLINWFFIGIKYSLDTLLLCVINALCAASVYLLSRASGFSLLAGGVAAAVIVTQVISMVRFRALEKRWDSAKKPSAAGIAGEVSGSAAKQGVSLAVIAALFLISCVVAGAVMSSLPLIYLAVMVFSAVAFPLYSGVFLLPNLWAASKK